MSQDHFKIKRRSGGSSLSSTSPLHVTHSSPNINLPSPTQINSLPSTSQLLIKRRTTTRKQISQSQTQLISPTTISPLSNSLLTQQTPIIGNHQKELEKLGQQAFEDFLDRKHTMDVNEALKITFDKLFLSPKTVLVWEIQGSAEVMFSRNPVKLMNIGEGLVSECYKTREIIFDNNPVRNAFYSEVSDFQIITRDSFVMLVPLYDSIRTMKYVIEIVRDSKMLKFTESDRKLADVFVKSFYHYSDYFTQEVIGVDVISELLRVMEVEQFLVLFQKQFKTLFHCKSVELWNYDRKTDIFRRYTNTGKIINKTKLGIAGNSLINHHLISCHNSKIHSSYNKLVDGDEEGAVLSFPIQSKQTKTRYAIVLRGKEGIPVFTVIEENSLRNLAPLIIIAFENDLEFSEMKKNSYKTGQQSSSSILLEAANKINDSPDKFIDLCSNLIKSFTGAAHAVFYFPNNDNGVLRAKVDKQTFDIPMRKGIVGKTYLTGQEYNIGCAYDDKDYDKTFDDRFLLHTVSLLSLPVFDQRRNVIAVFQLRNKLDGKPFSQEDIQISNAILNMVGLVVDNDYLYKQDQLREQKTSLLFKSISRISRTSHNIYAVLTDILTEAKDLFHCERFYLFRKENVEDNYEIVSTDCEEPYKEKIPRKALPTLSSFSNDAQNDKSFSDFLDKVTSFRTKNYISCPMNKLDGQFIGVIQLLNAETEFTSKDLRFMQIISTLCSLPVEIKELKEEMQTGVMQSEMKKVIMKEEEHQFEVPHTLKYTNQQEEETSGFKFNPFTWNIDDLFKVVLNIFSDLNLMKEYSIDAASLYAFIYEVRGEYQVIPFHNFLLAIDNLQYLYHIIKQGDLLNLFSPIEILGLTIATFCHNVGQSGVDNSFHKKINSPLYILFGDLSNEKYHYIVTYESIQKSGLFDNLSLLDQQIVWEIINKLIISTAMHPNELSKDVDTLIMNGTADMRNDNVRMTLLILLIKISSSSFAFRNWTCTNKWTSELFSEHYMQGDIERRLGVEINIRNKRGFVDKESEFVLFMEDELSVLVSCAKKILPSLSFLQIQLQNNLDKRKSKHIKNL